MTTNTKKKDRKKINHRHLLMPVVAVVVAVGLFIGTASAKTIIPGKVLNTNATKGGKRVAIINDALMQIGPPLALMLAERGHNLVIAQPAEGLVKACEAAGAKVIVVPGIEQEGPNDESQPGSTQKLVDAAMKHFGGFDSAYIRTAIHKMGDVLTTNAKDMQKIYESNFLAVLYSLQALMPPLMEKGAGQIVILTSATAGKPYYDMAGYSAMRAAANSLVSSAAMTGAPKGVVVNAIGTNFINYPDALKTLGGPDKMEIVSKNIPVGRFGETKEVAHTAVSLLDGRNMYATGLFIPFAGGYNNKFEAAASMAKE